jgi:hypothetical protein
VLCHDVLTNEGKGDRSLSVHDDVGPEERKRFRTCALTYILYFLSFQKFKNSTAAFAWPQAFSLS